MGQKLVQAKSNEITAIPQLPAELNIKGQVITIDAMGTQREIAAQIRSKRADYVLGLKGNQESLHKDVALYFSEPEFMKKSDYFYTKEKARILE